jgi:hypothetical protein
LFVIHPRVLKLGAGRAKLSVTIDIGRERMVSPQTQLRLVIYDFDAYLEDQSRQADEAAEKGEPEDDFEPNTLFFDGGIPPEGPRSRLVLPGALLNPTPQAGNGVLAVADLNLRRVETPAEQAVRIESGGSHWYVNELIGEIRTLGDSPFRIGLEMFAKRDDQGTFGQGTLRKQIIGFFGMARDDVLKLSSPRILALRLVSPVAQDPLARGTIVLSALNPLDNRVGVYRGVRSRGTQLDIKSVQETLKKPGGPTPADIEPSPLESRRAAFDLTGRYELEVEAPGVDVNAPDYIAPATLWLSQAGQAIVGWYTPYSAIGFNQRFTGHSDDVLPVRSRACLITSQSDDFPRKAFTFWCVDNGDLRIDPDRLLTSTEFPDETNDVLVRIGDLEVLDQGSVLTRVELVFSRKWALSDVPGEGGIEDEERATVGIFRRVTSEARLPWACIEQLRNTVGMSQKDVDAVIRSSIEPLPFGWWIRLGRRLRGPRTRDCIERFSRLRDSDDAVAQEFDRIGNIISELVNGFPNPQYRNEALAWVQSYSKRIFFRDVVQNREKSLEVWVQEITSAHLEHQRKNEEGRLGRKLTDAELKALREAQMSSQGGVLRDIGAFGGGDFEYEFEFNSIAAEFKLIVAGTVGGFTCVVKKTKIPADGSPRRLEYSLAFLGVFASVGVGLNLNPLNGKFSGKGDDGKPPSCKIRSFHDISIKDWGTFPFPATTFNIAAVGSELSADMTIVEIQTALSKSSTLFSLSIPGEESGNEFQLSGIIDEAGEWEIKASDISQIMKKIEDGDFFDLNAMIFALTQSYGRMYDVEDLDSIPPPDKSLPIVPDQDRPVSTTVDRPLIAFEKGSSIIQAHQLLDLDRRMALYRRLLELPGWYWATGFTSPEWHARKDQAAEKNQQLSQNRAVAVDAAVRASVGLPGEGVINKDQQHVAPHGAGRGPSLASTLEDPPGGGLTDPYAPDADPETVRRQEQEEYHKWRRVDLTVNATLTARVWGE